jgi:hypothetical protein
MFAATEMAGLAAALKDWLYLCREIDLLRVTTRCFFNVRDGNAGELCRRPHERVETDYQSHEEQEDGYAHGVMLLPLSNKRKPILPKL